MAPKRLQRLLLRLLVYDVILTYRCGRQMQLADTLSRAYLPLTDATPFEMEVQSVNMVQDFRSQQLNWMMSKPTLPRMTPYKC